ncbi:MAG: hypothetical protein FJ139_07665 [Deltaproteobacteria bacterium]|nr:hypothetical protein [Deltaproteobacteria bacterium]
MKKSTLSGVSIFAGLLLITVLATQAYAFEIGVRGYYWFPDLKAELKVDKGGLTGTQFDVKNELGIGNESFPSVEVYGGVGKHHFSVMYTQFHYSGDRTITRSINFAGKTFTAGTRVESDLETKMLDIEYQYDLLNMENILAGFSLGVIGKIKYFDGEASLKSSALGAVKETFAAPVPMVGIGAHIGLLANILEARAKIAGIGYSGSVFYDALADISVTPFPFLDIHGGYRIMKLKIDNVSDFYGDLEFAGPYVALTVGF